MRKPYISILLMDLPYLIIYSICDREVTTKSALKVPSLSLIPMPTSASLMAIRSFAPSPTILMFFLKLPKNLEISDFS